MKRFAVIAALLFATIAQATDMDSLGLRADAWTNATLGTPANGTVRYCSDCAKANPCAGSGSGAVARRENGAWNCSVADADIPSTITRDSEVNVQGTTNEITSSGSGVAPTLSIATAFKTAGGDLTGTFPSPTVAANAVALTTDTTGNYAAGDAEAGSALTGDSATAFFSAGSIDVAQGGTGLTAGTSGGVPYYSSTSAISSSGALTANALVKGGGAGASPASSTLIDDGSTVTGTVPFRMAAGTAAAPTYSFSGDPDSGMFSISDNVYGIAIGSVNRLQISSVASGGEVGIFNIGGTGSGGLRFYSASGAPLTTSQMRLSNDDANVLQLGDDAATATAQTIESHDITTAGTDIAAASLVLSTGKSTGTGVGSVIIAAAPAGTAGTTQNTPTTGLTVTARGALPVLPASQTIAGGDIVAADACGGEKRISSAGAVTTSTTDTFTAPAAANANCIMYVCNTAANQITLDRNANFVTSGGVDVVLTDADDCVAVGSDGVIWRQLGSVMSNS